MKSESSDSKPRCTFGRLSRESVLFTGPDGIRDYKAKVDAEHRYVGEGTMSPEGTSEADYLWRAPSSTPHPKSKSISVGEIGWGVNELHKWFASSQTGAQLMLGEFKQAAEDRHTHLLQNPWYPGPKNETGFNPENNETQRDTDRLVENDINANSQLDSVNTENQAVEEQQTSLTSLKGNQVDSSNNVENDTTT